MASSPHLFPGTVISTLTVIPESLDVTCVMLIAYPLEPFNPKKTAMTVR
jgi:hypothetical protein